MVGTPNWKGSLGSPLMTCACAWSEVTQRQRSNGGSGGADAGLPIGINLYAIREGQRGPIKFGVTGGSPWDRRMDLSTGNSQVLTVLGYCRLMGDSERWLHGELAAWRVRGEWFEDGFAVRSMARWLCQLGRQQRAMHCLWPQIGFRRLSCERARTRGTGLVTFRGML